MPPSAHELTKHVSFEVHWLVYSAVKYAPRHKNRTVFQDSAFLHARNILELTRTGNKGGAWRMINLGGSTPPWDAVSRTWSALINNKAAHLSKARLGPGPRWPVPEDKVKLIALARHVLGRLVDATKGSDPRAVAVRRIAKRGLRYLDSPTAEHLESLAALT